MIYKVYRGKNGSKVGKAVLTTPNLDLACEYADKRAGVFRMQYVVTQPSVIGELVIYIATP